MSTATNREASPPTPLHERSLQERASELIQTCLRHEDLTGARTVRELLEAAQSETAKPVWKPGEPRVVCAAIRDKAGRIVTGARHYDAVMMEQIKRDLDGMSWRAAEQGFIDQFGNFLTREEAMVIATKWGQIIRDDEGRQSLYSENLY